MRTKTLIAAVAGITLASSLAACGQSPQSSTNPEAAKIAFFVPEDTSNWPLAKAGFEKGLKEACPSCQMLYYSAAGDATKQQSQAQTAILEGAKALVISAVDGKASATITNAAKAKNIPVLGFGRTPGGPLTATMAWSDEEIGKVTAEGLTTALKPGSTDGQLVFLNGDATTPNTPGMAKGAGDVVSEFTIGRSYNIPAWSAANAQTSMDQAITALGKDKVAGVLGADDNIAAGAIASMKRAGISPLPPVVGMGGSPSAVQLILKGEMFSTAFLDYGALGQKAADVAHSVVKGGKPQTEGTLKNATGDDVPLVKAPAPVLVTKENIKSVLVDSGVLKISDVCTPEYETDCKAASLTP